jgi:hypothetical protein
MKNLSIIILFFALSSCKLIQSVSQENKDLAFGAIKELGKNELKKILGLNELNWNKDTVKVAGSYHNEVLRKKLGKGFANFCTSEGENLLQTRKFKAHLIWQPIDSLFTRITFEYYKK